MISFIPSQGITCPPPKMISFNEQRNMWLDTTLPAAGKKDFFSITYILQGWGKDIFCIINFILICLAFSGRS